MTYDPVRRALVFLSLLAPLSAGPVTFSVLDLGALDGLSSSAYGINASGMTAGTRTNQRGDLRAFSGSVDITPSGADQARASAINASGVIAGTAYLGGTPFATVWSGTGVQLLSAGSYGMGINNAGQVTGMAVNGAGFGHAFLNTAGIMRDLGVLPGGDWSSGYGINSWGNVAGYGNDGWGNFRGFVWNPSTGMTALGTFGGANSYAMAINDRGQVAGSAQTSSGYMHAFLASGTRLTDLGTLGGNSSYAYSINRSGAVVGYSLGTGGEALAFLYLDGVMYDLNRLLVEATGWQLTAAYGINDRGQIAGSGLLNGVEHSFLLDPVTAATGQTMALGAPAAAFAVNPVPEPATWILMFAAGAVLAALRPRRQ